MGDLYRLYIDESGDHHYGGLRDHPSNRYLCLIGVALKKEIRIKLHNDLSDMMSAHFNFDPDDPVILHRLDIIHKRGPFYILQTSEKKEAFNEDLLNLLRNLDCKLFVVVIDKKSHYERYEKAALHPYHYAIIAMLERYCGYLNFINSRGDILAEERGKKEDNKLREAYSYIYNSGTSFRESNFFQRALTSKNITLKSKKSNIAGIQIADLLAHPCKQLVLYKNGKILKPKNNFGLLICDAMKYKYNMHVYSGRVDGYGQVFIS